MSQTHLFHGTRRGFTKGGWLFPRTMHAGAATSAPTNPGRQPLADSAEWVYLTEDIDVAWAYAWAAPGRGKPKVVEVEPHGRIEPDPEHSPAMRAWRAESAVVRRVHTEPTITETEAREGWSA